MGVACILLMGVVIAILSVLPPGLLNMSAAKISLSEGRTRGVVFSIGASLVVLLQTYIGAAFARYLSIHQEVIDALRLIAFFLFLIITIYFLFIAKEKEKKEEPTIKSKKSSFFYGMLLSVLNVFPIPYQAYMTVTLSSYGLMDFSKINIFSYIVGVSMGTFIALYLYIIFFDKIKIKSLTSKKNMNYIIGGITGLIAVVTLINVVKNM